MEPRNPDNQSQLRHYLIPALVLVFLVSSVSAFFILEDNRNGEDDQAPAAAAPDTQAVTVGAGAALVNSLTAADLPLDPGMEYTFNANSPGSPTDVGFDLIGPWDFADGPEQLILTMRTLESDNAPAAQYFSDATVAIYSTWSRGQIQPSYSFQSLDSDSWLAYGSSGDSGVALYESPSRALIFPASVGDSWVDKYQQEESGRSVNITAENRIVAFNTLTVPAGTFDAYLLQIKVTNYGGSKPVVTWDYVWLSPGIGRTAEIISLPAEENDVFDRAYAFYRLEQYGSS